VTKIQMQTVIDELQKQRKEANELIKFLRNRGDVLVDELKKAQEGRLGQQLEFIAKRGELLRLVELTSHMIDEADIALVNLERTVQETAAKIPPKEDLDMLELLHGVFCLAEETMAQTDGNSEISQKSLIEQFFMSHEKLSARILRDSKARAVLQAFTDITRQREDLRDVQEIRKDLLLVKDRLNKNIQKLEPKELKDNPDEKTPNTSVCKCPYGDKWKK